MKEREPALDCTTPPEASQSGTTLPKVHPPDIILSQASLPEGAPPETKLPGTLAQTTYGNPESAPFKSTPSDTAPPKTIAAIDLPSNIPNNPFATPSFNNTASPSFNNTTSSPTYSIPSAISSIINAAASSPPTRSGDSSPKMPRVKKILVESARKRSLSRLLPPSQSFEGCEDGRVTPNSGRSRAGASEDGRSTPNSGRSSHSQSMLSLCSMDVPFLDQQKKKWIVSCSACDETSIKSLLKENPKLISVVDPCSGYSALHWTAKRNNMDLMIFLLSSTVANVNATSHGGYSPLHIAAMQGHKQMFLLLMNQFMGDSSLRDNSGRTPSSYFQTHKFLSNVYGSMAAHTDHKNSCYGNTYDVSMLRQKKNFEREMERRKKVQMEKIEEEKLNQQKNQPNEAKFARNFGYSSFVTRS